MDGNGVLRLRAAPFAQDDGLRGGEDDWWRFWGGQGLVGFFDDFGWGSWVGALGEFFGGEELGVAVVAVAGAQEVEETLLGDGNGARSCRLQVRGCRLAGARRSRSLRYAAG
jgi:hypothetical protein